LSRGRLLVLGCWALRLATVPVFGEQIEKYLLSWVLANDLFVQCDAETWSVRQCEEAIHHFGIAGRSSLDPVFGKVVEVFLDFDKIDEAHAHGPILVRDQFTRMHDQLQQLLKDDPASANDLTTGNSPLGWAVYGQQPKSATILFQHGAVADRPPYDSYAWGPASGVSSIDVTRVLLEHGANPNWRDEAGNSAIHRAITSRMVLDPAKFIQLLLDFGADASLRNREGRTALDEAILQTRKIAETYFPVRPIAPKRLEQAIEMLLSRLGQTS